MATNTTAEACIPQLIIKQVQPTPTYFSFKHTPIEKTGSPSPTLRQDFLALSPDVLTSAPHYRLHLIPNSSYLR